MGSAPLIPSTWQLPDVFRRRLGRSVGRQRLMTHDEHLLIVAHDVPGVDQDTRQGILFWRDNAGEWHASNGDRGTVALDNLLGQYEKRIEEIDQAEAKACLAEEYLPVLEGLAPVARAARNLCEVLQEARKAASEVPELIDLRDRAYDLARTAELAYQYAKDSMDVAVVKRAEEQAAASTKMALASHRLNIMAAIFFPLATLSGIFGTTLTENWSWSQTPVPFYIFIAVGFVAGILLASFVSWKRK